MKKEQTWQKISAELLSLGLVGALVIIFFTTLIKGTWFNYVLLAGSIYLLIIVPIPFMILQEIHELESQGSPR